MHRVGKDKLLMCRCLCYESPRGLGRCSPSSDMYGPIQAILTRISLWGKPRGSAATIPIAASCASLLGPQGGQSSTTSACACCVFHSSIYLGGQARIRSTCALLCQPRYDLTTPRLGRPLRRLRCTLCRLSRHRESPTQSSY